MKPGDTLSGSLGDLATKPLPLDDGTTTTLSAAQSAGKALILFFVPKAFTSGCTAEACSFRDAYSAFTDAGAVVLGISSDSPKTQAQWREANRLPFNLATDAKGELRKALGVQPTLFVLPGRETFVFDKSGKLLMRFSSQMDVHGHVTRALEALGLKK
jgi:thioredoxin-dependent peroxiredoxin